MKQIIVIIFILFAVSTNANSTKVTDTLEQWRGKFYNLEIQTISSGSKWVVARKNYQNNRDTVMVLSSGKAKNPLGTLEKMGEFSFVGNHTLLASGNDRAVLWDLEKDMKTKYENVRLSGNLNNDKGYFLIDQERNCRIYNSRRQLLYTFNHIKYIKRNIDGTQTFLIREYGEGNEIIGIGDLKQSVFYKTSNILKSVELSPSGKKLLVTEYCAKSEKQLITLIDTKNRDIENAEIPDIKQNDFIKFTEIQNGKSFIITLITHKALTSNEVDIWYGNDHNLEAKIEGKISYKHWLWNSDLKTLKNIPTNSFSTIVSLDSPRYYLAFNENELHNYTTQFPLINAFLYDMEEDSYQNIDIMKSEISVSYSGKYIIYKDRSENWILFETKTAKKQVIGKNDIQQPVFSYDNRYVFFESKSDLKKYTVKNGQLETLNIAPGAEVKIQNKHKRTVYQQAGFDFSVTCIKNGKPLLISTTDAENRKTFLLVKDNIIQRIVGPVDYNIKMHINPRSENSYCYVMENLNVPPRLVCRDLQQKDSTIIFKSNVHDNDALKLKKDIISYKNTDGNLLKGILYYPSHYDIRKKYPMIVHLYEIQNKGSNQYLSPLNTFPVAFNIRLMLEKGYFVFLPDVVSDSSGVGLAALHCVNSAMDVVQNNKNVDMSKVGLIGHSFGGYLTNFIATHSNRFATYISGAGASDVVRMYFSYNYTSGNPFYWQFESGQYPMKGSFADNKDLYLVNSPIQYVENVSAPILLWAGKEDKRIDSDQVLEFYVGLRKNNKSVIALFYPKQPHVFKRGSTEEKDLSTKINEWFDYFLMNKQNIDWINIQMKKDAL